MKQQISIKDLIYFGAIGEAFNITSLKLQWSWKYACGCVGDSLNRAHSYADCLTQENLFWSDRFTELGRTIKMPLMQDEIEVITVKMSIEKEDTDKLLAIIIDAEDILGTIGTEYYDIFVQRMSAKDRMSLLDDHALYTKTKDWYLENDISPTYFEEIKVNVTAKYLAEILLKKLQLSHLATMEATWTPNINENEELLFSEHVVKIDQIDHVTSESGDIKAPSS